MNDKWRERWLLVLSSLLSAIFFWSFFSRAGCPPVAIITSDEWRFLFVAIFFLLIPFVSKIKLGKLIEIERELKNTKSDLSGFKETTNQVIQTLLTSVSAVATLHNTINISLPSNRELIEAKRVTGQNIGLSNASVSSSVRDQLLNEETSEEFALVKARVRIEELLRKILSKRIVYEDKESRLKFFSLYRLFEFFVREYPDYKGLLGPFVEINSVLNAAAHAQIIPGDQAETTLDIASDIIAILEDVLKKSGGV